MKAKDSQKYIIPALATLALVFLLKKSPAKQAQQQISNEIDRSKLSYPLSQYDAWANKLEQAFFDWGTNETSIYEVFRNLKNNNDFLQLKKAFGIRQYTGGILPGILSGKLNLDGFIEQELNSSEQKYINGILASKSITYRV